MALEILYQNTIMSRLVVIGLQIKEKREGGRGGGTMWDFVPEYYHVKFGGNWTTNKGETGGGGGRHNVYILYFTKITQPEYG